MSNILVVDFSTSKDEIKNVLRDCGYSVEVVDSAFDAMTKLRAYDFDLVVSEVDLPGDNAFELYNYIFTNYPYIPAIMISGKEIDPLFDRILEEGIGNVLCKPIDKDELLNLANKLISRKNIFGLGNHLKDIEVIKKIKVTSSGMIKDSISVLIKQIKDWDFKIKNEIVLNLVLNEIIINAVYHSHGYTKEKEQRKQITLKENEYVDIFFTRNKNSYGISVTDYVGTLSKKKILESLHKAIKQSQLIIEAAIEGKEVTSEISETGRGIDLLRKTAIDYYFIIEKGVRTEVILIFDTDKSNANKLPSLKIIER